jgi:hypothetical protein
MGARENVVCGKSEARLASALSNVTATPSFAKKLVSLRLVFAFSLTPALSRWEREAVRMRLLNRDEL